ncbi:hypothetical protein PHISP_01240 [Aspergillus sp. HF37]|nr:hypothetical protein PHISP_01240 [Aspergillus sp. HF37]
MVNWTDQADAKLLVSILHTSTPRIDYAAVAKLMGEDVTISAIKHRIQRLKDKVDASATNGAAGSPKSPAKFPAKKRGRRSKAKDDAKDADKSREPAAKKAKANGDAADGEEAAS